MIGQRTSLLLVIPAIAWIGAAVAQTQDTDPGERAAIDKAYRAWAEADNAKDLTRWVSFLAPDALFLPPNHVAMRTHEAIRAFYAELFADKNFKLDCRQDEVVVSASRDIAWSTGVCRSTFTRPSGRIADDTSKWVKLWKRQSNGEWKCAVNGWNSDLQQPEQ